MLAVRIGTKRSIFLGLAAYTGISIIGYFMKSARDFYILAFLVGIVQGGTQALSRSLFATLIPAHKSGEYFGFFSVFEKFGGIAGPALFAVLLGAGAQTRVAVLATIAFFVVGGAILLFVDTEAGERAARAADATAKPV